MPGHVSTTHWQQSALTLVCTYKWVPFGCFAGSDPEKLKLSAALPVIFNKCKKEYQSRPDMTGAELYDFVTRCAIAVHLKQTHKL